MDTIQGIPQNYYLRRNIRKYSLRPEKSVVLEFQISCLTIRLIQIFYISIIYFVKTYFIIRYILLMIYLFYNLHKIF